VRFDVVSFFFDASNGEKDRVRVRVNRDDDDDDEKDDYDNNSVAGTRG